MTFCLQIERQNNTWRNTVLTFSVGIVPVMSSLLLSVSVPATATASPTYTDGTIPRERVRIDDLDLRTRGGWHTAKRRLQVAAARVCSGQPASFDAFRCRTDSVTRAQSDLVRQFGVHNADTKTDAAERAPIRGRSIARDQNVRDTAVEQLSQDSAPFSDMTSKLRM